ncbi:hypothetical protein NDU88_003074 [Pleurodeles waltl]|uniref:Uncharacterized protein n=1 Tax=Pleurodeles waltl TaxID=8319 RepID=A0AAV7T566_PLEWA|nr:hypothetical protein NDU88_003074 [Pleurodeles waltl]
MVTRDAEQERDAAGWPGEECLGHAVDPGVRRPGRVRPWGPRKKVQLSLSPRPLGPSEVLLWPWQMMVMGH